MSWLVLLVTVFAVTFIAELPDKSLIATLVLSTRYRPAYVWLGVAAAFAVHVVLAVTAGGLLTLAPRSVVQAITGVLFLAGAVWMLRSGSPDENVPGPDAARQGQDDIGLRRVFATSFAVIFVGEWGDITQITTANFAARYDSPLLVGIAAMLGLWAVSGLAVVGGAKLLQRVPARWVRVISALALTGLGISTLNPPNRQ